MINANLNGGGQTSKSDLITHFTSRVYSKCVAWGAGLGIRVIKLNIELLQLVLSLNVLKTCCHQKHTKGSQDVHTLPLILLGCLSRSLMKKKLNEEILYYYQMHADCLLDAVANSHVTDVLKSYCQLWLNTKIIRIL